MGRTLHAFHANFWTYDLRLCLPFLWRITWWVAYWLLRGKAWHRTRNLLLSSRGRIESFKVTWRPLMKDFRDLHKSCCCTWPKWNYLSAVVEKVLRLLPSVTSAPLFGWYGKFSTEFLFLSCSMFWSSISSYWLHCKVPLTFFACILGKFLALLKKWMA